MMLVLELVHPIDTRDSVSSAQDKAKTPQIKPNTLSNILNSPIDPAKAAGA
jgi:hypothetical protein